MRNIFHNNREHLIVLACNGAQDQGDLIILPLSQDLIADGPIQLLPYGEVKSKKGDFLVDELAIKEVIANFKRQKNDAVIDYEHQTLKDVIAPAAGWIKELIDRGKEGLWAVVEWTARAKEFIVNKEYRYISPVILVRESDRRPLVIHSAGMTNTPAIDGMKPIANKNAGGLSPEEEKNMEFLKKMAALLGLPETATEEEVLAAIDNLIKQGQVIANKDVLTLLGLSEKATLDETKGAIIALKNPSGYVSVEQFNTLKTKLELRDRDELVEIALKSGRVAPAQKGWAEEYALKDPAGFKAFLEKAPVVVPLKEIGGGKDPVRHNVDDATQLLVNKSFGISDEDFKKYGGD